MSKLKPFNIIGPQILKLRNERGWTQEQLVERFQQLGWVISASRLAKIEARTERVRDFELLFFMNIFCVDFNDLYPHYQKGTNDDNPDAGS